MIDFASLEITKKCNLECRHCFVESSPHMPLTGALNSREWKDIILELDDLGCKSLQFIGGEPTLHPDFRELVRLASSCDFDVIEVYTNGVGLSDGDFSLFQDLGVSLAFSFYSHEEETHTAFTRNRGSFRKTVSSIQRAVLCDIPHRVSVVFDPCAEESERTKTVQYLIDLGVDKIGVDEERAIGRAARETMTLDETTHELCGACGTHRLSIDFNGSIYPCQMANKEPIGHVSEGILSSYNSSRMELFKKRIASLKKRPSQSDCLPNGCLPDFDMCSPDFECRPKGGGYIYVKGITA